MCLWNYTNGRMLIQMGAFIQYKIVLKIHGDELTLEPYTIDKEMACMGCLLPPWQKEVMFLVAFVCL